MDRISGLFYGAQDDCLGQHVCSCTNKQRHVQPQTHAAWCPPYTHYSRVRHSERNILSMGTWGMLLALCFGEQQCVPGLTSRLGISSNKPYKCRTMRGYLQKNSYHDRSSGCEVSMNGVNCQAADSLKNPSGPPQRISLAHTAAAVRTFSTSPSGTFFRAPVAHDSDIWGFAVRNCFTALFLWRQH